LRNVMLLSALSRVPFVPVEAFNPIQCEHMCILSQYTPFKGNIPAEVSSGRIVVINRPIL
jgi:hypothetical protein